MYDVRHTVVTGSSIASLTMAGSGLEDATGRSRPPSVVAVVGFSDTGKTTLLERLIPRMRARGLTVGAIKHTSHGFAADRPGKDSHRIYSAGACAVTLVSGQQLATFRRRAEGDVSLSEALAELPVGLDLVLVEGFAWEPVPRIVLVRVGQVLAKDHLEAGPVLATLEVDEPLADGPPEFKDDVLESLVEQLTMRVHSVHADEKRLNVGPRRLWRSIASELAKEIA